MARRPIQQQVSPTPPSADLEPLLLSPPHQDHLKDGIRRSHDEFLSRDDEIDEDEDDDDGDVLSQATSERHNEASRRRRRRGSPAGLFANLPSSPPPPPSSTSLPVPPPSSLSSSWEFRRQLVVVRMVTARCGVPSGFLTLRECTALIGILGVSSAVTCLVHESLHGRPVAWQLAMVNLAALLLCAIDRFQFSTQFAVRWSGLLLLVSAPVLSGSAVLVMAAMVAMPLQCAIYRHRQAVTLEACKDPPRARVKSIDVQTHPDHAVLALAYYTGHAVLWRVPYEKDGRCVAAEAEAPAIAKEVCHQQPLRSVRFVSHHFDSAASPEPSPWNGSVLVAGDDGKLVQISGTTMNVDRSTRAHADFCRCVEVHPTHPVVFTAADDCSIKVWEAAVADNGQFAARHVLEGHDDFVMQVRCHPDGRSFVSASLDATLRRWAMESTKSEVTVPSLAPALTFRGHAQGVNCVDFLVRDGSQTVLVSGSDDLSIKLWNYQDGSLIRTISNAHQDNINAILIHPHRPIMISACEDGSCNIWSFQLDENGNVDVLLQDTWYMGKGRAWALAWVGYDDVAIGFDQGCGIFRVQSDDQWKHEGGAAPPSSSTGHLSPREHVRWLSQVEFVT